MGKDTSIRSIFKQYEPGLYAKDILGKGQDCYNIFNLEYAKCYYFDMLYTLAISIPTWEGLPLEVDKSIMERILINNTCVVFTYDDILEKYLTLVLGKVTKYDTNGRPLNYSASTLFGNIIYNDLNPDNSVIIWDRVTNIPTLTAIEFYAGRLANLRLSIDQCVRNLKVPYIMTTTSNNMAALEGIMSEIYNYKPAIILDGIAEVDSVKMTSLADSIPSALQALRNEFTNTFNEALSAIGIANVSQEEGKAEQMSVYEVAKTVTGSMMQQESRLKPRQQGAELINDVFELDVKVSFSQAMTSLDGITDSMNEENFMPNNSEVKESG